MNNRICICLRYGDIVPSGIIPRTFAIMWILVGLVTSAILMGAITSVLTTASVLGEAKVYGKQVSIIYQLKCNLRYLIYGLSSLSIFSPRPCRVLVHHLCSLASRVIVS